MRADVPTEVGDGLTWGTMRTSEIRTRWLDYFEKQGHEVCPSVSLVSPEPSILFTIAGMVPFIPYIMGVEPAPWPRATSVQKCIRTNDIDNVARPHATARSFR